MPAGNNLNHEKVIQGFAIPFKILRQKMKI